MTSTTLINQNDDNCLDKVQDLYMHCVNCGNPDFSTILNGYDFDTGTDTFLLEQCNQCSLVRTAPVLTDEQLAPYYARQYYGSGSKKFTAWIEHWVRYNNNKKAKSIFTLLAGNNPSPDILDIGCGRAQLLRALASMGCHCTGMERGNFPTSGQANLHIIQQDFLQASLGEQQFDVIIIWHVLEHLSDPVKAMEKISRLLKPGGILVLSVPNFGSFQAKLFGAHWFHLDLPRHTYHFCQATITKLLAKNGVTVTSSSSRTIDQSIYGFIQSCLNSTGVFKTNSLYSLLKSSTNRPPLVSAMAQCLLGLLVSPIAILEYIFSGVAGKGSCLVITAQKPGVK